uniref:sodium/hydrogen exchanger 9B1-like n=1 Tax=Styela clava TaxID=7725 RepID=UPI00193A4026|nr:sodium/hydrogen exchanger 9B1-like [Styela clava]
MDSDGVIHQLDEVLNNEESLYRPKVDEISNAESEEGLHLEHIKYPEHYEYHMKKGGQFKTKAPVDLDSEDSVGPGCGLDENSCNGKCALFWGERCMCTTRNTFLIGLKRVVTRIIMCFLFWGFFWSITAITNHSALPGGNLFGILMVFLFGIAGESLIEKIPLPFDLPGLPPLLASLVVGIILRNVPGISVAKWIKPNWSFTLRQMALGVILGEAGVEVDKQQMYLLRWVVPRLSFLPCLSEAFSWGIFSHWILSLPWLWSFMLGFVCGAVAPACVVPSMIRFQAKGMGVLRGVPTLCMAAASIDDIIAINGFNILLTITFSTGGIGYDIGVAVVEICLGIILGMIAGYLMWFFPDPRQHNIVRDRTFLLVFTSWFLIFMTNVVNLSGAGTLGTLTCSFVGSLGWPLEQVHAVAKVYKSVWYWFSPLLFGLTGANVDVTIMDGHTIGLAVGCMCLCLAVRLTVAGSAVSFLGWMYREKFMTAVTWIPKATVQAAIGGVALDHANDLCAGRTWPPLCNTTTGTTETYYGSGFNWTTSDVMITSTEIMTTGAMNTTFNNETYGTTIPSCVTEYDYPSPLYCQQITGYGTLILQVSVVVILITAPVGVFLIGVFGPILLRVDDPNITGKKPPDDNSIELGESASGFEEKMRDDVFDPGHDNQVFTKESDTMKYPTYANEPDKTSTSTKL